MRGAPPVPSATENNNLTSRKMFAGAGPYHVKSNTELDGFASPGRQKGIIINHHDKSGARKRNYDLQKKFVKLMKDDMFGNDGSNSNRTRFAS